MDTEGELRNFHLLEKVKMLLSFFFLVKLLLFPNTMHLSINKSIAILILNVNTTFSSF